MNPQAMLPPDPSSTEGPRIILSSSESREVSWALAHEVLWPVIERALRHGPLPLIGTHQWLELPDGDPRKVGAIWLAADWKVLAIEIDQEARADAVSDIAAGANWRAIGRHGRDQAAFLAAHPDLRRKAS